MLQHHCLGIYEHRLGPSMANMLGHPCLLDLSVYSFIHSLHAFQSES